MAAQQGCSPVISSLCLVLGSFWVRTQLFPHHIQLGSGTPKQTLLSCYRAQCSLWAMLQPMLLASSLSSGTVKIHCGLPGRYCSLYSSLAKAQQSYWVCSGSVGCWYVASVGRSFTIVEQPCPLHTALFWEGGSQGAERLCHRPRCAST